MKSVISNTLNGTPGLYDYRFTTSSYAYLNSPLKRGMDIVGASVGLMLGMPVFLVAALIVKIVDRVPVIFRQERMGFRGKPFTFYKLRTLKLIDERAAVRLDRIQHKPNYETTLTGKLWRVTSIDEIIQFWLVLKGVMSLIGHRPLPMYYLEYLDKIDGMDQHKLAHYLKIVGQYKPGMSSLSSVKGRGDLSMQQKMEYDLIYAQNANFLLDLRLLLSTVVVVLTRRGAK